MNKNELISQLTSLVEDHTEGLRSANNKLFHSGQRLTAEKQEWEQKYHSAMAANKKLEERNEGLQVEKQALLDVVSEWKSKVQSLTVLNKTISEEPNMLRRDNQVLLKTVQIWQRDYTQALREKDILVNEMEALSAALAAEKETVEDLQRRYEEAHKAGNHWFGEFKKIAIHCEKQKAELQELKKGEEALLRTIQNWERNYTSIKHELDQVRKELAEADAERLRLHCLLQSRTEELAAAEKRHEDLKTKSHGILATLEENLQKKQETIEALTVWKKGTESVLNTLEAKLKDAKDVIHTQENTIEWLDGRVRRLKAKKAKKEQND